MINQRLPRIYIRENEITDLALLLNLKDKAHLEHNEMVKYNTQ